MRFEIKTLARSADATDLSAATTAKRTGPAAWTADGWLDIPFDRALTAAEVVAVTRLLTAPTDAVATLRTQLQDYLALTSPSTADSKAAITSLARLVLDVLDRK